MLAKRFVKISALLSSLFLLVMIGLPIAATAAGPGPWLPDFASTPPPDVPPQPSAHGPELMQQLDPSMMVRMGIQQTDKGLWYKDGKMAEGEGGMGSVGALGGLAPQNTGGPDDFGYTWDDSVPFAWIDATNGTNTGLVGDDKYTDAINIGFDFKFYENTYSALYVSTNGLITFGQGYYHYSNTPIPLEAPPNNLITPFWDDLCVNYSHYNSGAVYYKRGGTAPNRYFVVEWHEISRLGSTDLLTFQVILHENGDIVMQYLTLSGYLGGATVGIEDDMGVNGLQYLYNTQGLTNHKAIHFHRPGPQARAKSWPLYQGSFIRAGNVAPFTVHIRNNGGIGTDTYDISLTSGWPASLFHEDGVTPLADTDSDGVIDTGPVPQGETRIIIVKIQAPAQASVGAHNEITMTVRSSLDTEKKKTGSVRTAVPAPFAQVYRDGANGAMSIALVKPEGERTQKTTEDNYWGYNVAVTELPDHNFIYAWSKGRRNENDAWVNEIEYTILGPTGQVIKSVTRLTDHSGASSSTYDYSPALAVAADGRIGVLWGNERDNDANKFNQNLYFATLALNGDVLTHPHNITNNNRWGYWNDLHVPRFYSPRLTAIGGNRFALAWGKSYYDTPTGDCTSHCDVSDIWYAIYGSDGREVKAPTQLTHDTPGWDESFGNPALTTMNREYALLPFTRGSDNDIYYAILNKNGHVVRQMTNLSQDGHQSYDWNPDAVQLKNGTLVVAWTGGDYPQYEIHFATIDAGGNPATTPKNLPNPAARLGNGYVSVTADGSNHAVLTWMDYHWSYRPNLYYALVDSAGNIKTPATIFLISQSQSARIETSFEGYGNTSFSWQPPTNLDIDLYLPLLLKRSR